MLTTVERAAHARLDQLIQRRLMLPGRKWAGQRVLKSRAADRNFIVRMEPLLNMFATRCNCGLRPERTLDRGVYTLTCQCGASWREA